MTELPDELSIARARRQNADTEPATRAATWESISRTLDEFVRLHRECVNRHGRAAENEWQYRSLCDSTGARSIDEHIRSLASLLTVAIDRLSKIDDRP